MDVCDFVCVFGVGGALINCEVRYPMVVKWSLRAFAIVFGVVCVWSLYMILVGFCCCFAFRGVMVLMILYCALDCFLLHEVGWRRRFV